MTKFKVYRISGSGTVTVEIVEAFDWTHLVNTQLYSGGAIFKVEVCGATEPEATS